MPAVADAALARVLSGYPSDPVAYARDVLDATLTPDQQSLPALLLNPPHRLLIPSGNKLGKSFALGWLINWFHDSFDPGVCLVTSSSYRSVRTQVFKEVRRLRPMQRNLKPRAPEIFDHGRHFALGFSADHPDSFQGQHESNWMLVMDEATGVSAQIADRAETMFSGVKGHAWVCAYNPNDPTTWPYAAEQSGGWAVKRLSALDHPNVAAELRGEPPPFPGAVRLHRVRERVLKECEDCGGTAHDETCFEFAARPGEKARWWKPKSVEFSPQVLGRWPEHATNAIWSDADRKRCSAAVAVNPDWPVQIGLDCARFGNARWAFAVRKGTALVHLEERTHWPTRQVSRHAAERLRELCYKYAPPGVNQRQVPCLIDDTGGFGSGVTDHPEGHNFIGVNSSSSASDPSKFPNKRSELWFNTRLAADQGGFFTGSCGVGAELVEGLWQELTAVRYTLDAKNRRVAEGKAACSERLRRSPDSADALNLAWYPVG